MSTMIRERFSTDPMPHIKVDGVEGYDFLFAGPDVNGMWGGYRAMLGHFRKIGEEEQAGHWNELLYVYLLVGPYYEIGKSPDDPLGPSVFAAARLTLEALEAGVEPKAVYEAVDALKKQHETKQAMMQNVGDAWVALIESDNST